jgi:hypothetical protein
MSEQELFGWMIIGLIVCPVALFAWLLNDAQERRDRERWNDEHSPFVLLMADQWDVSREEAYRLICETERRLGIRK